MNSFIMRITCPRCQRPVEEVNLGEPVDGGMTVNGVVRCTAPRCRQEFGVHVMLIPMGIFDDSGQVHGVQSAVSRHQKAGESLCDECTSFKARQIADRKVKVLAQAKYREGRDTYLKELVGSS